ncbi:Bcr/CflA family drug resistance efflux transporter, partial [Francisella tularensis subsp. holarctica]|nr:Bcr/CflA family drug resistance efflux transporter [Francisella tularensis subsp. holarctica]
ALTPAFGAVLGVFLSPTAIFGVSLVAASILFIKVAIFFPETLREKNFEALTFKSFFKYYFLLFKDHQFFFDTFVLGIIISVIYACLVTEPD